MNKRSVIALLLTLTLFGLHQDFWNWREARPLWFGFLPAGLAYHAVYTLAAAAWMAALVKVIWPGHLEEDARGPQA